MEKEEKKLYPGDKGYQGGAFRSTVVIDGHAKNVYTVKDADGNIRFLSVTDKIFGIF